jgi:hypothetical protein
MSDTKPLMIVHATSFREPRQPEAKRFACRLCKQYCRPMKRETAIHHLFKFHGYGWLGAEMAVERTESEHETLMAERERGKRLLDALEVY